MKRRLFVGVLVCLVAGPAQASLIAHYAFDGDASDVSGNGHNGTVHGATLTADRFGNQDSAYLFDGDDYIDIGNGLRQSFPMTVSAWVYQDTFDKGSVFHNDLNKNNHYYGAGFNILADGKLRSGYGDGGYAAHWSRRNKETQNSVLTTGEWHHLVAVFDRHNINGTKNNVSFFVDGNLISEINKEGTGGSVGYGGYGGRIGSGLEALIDDVRVYDHALSSDEVLSLYDAVTPVPIPSALLLFGSSLAGLLVVAKNRRSSESWNKIQS